VCRHVADKAVIGTDGQNSTLLSVLYQQKHGHRTQGGSRKSGSLLLVKPHFSESAPNVISALSEAVGADGRDQVRLVCSDSPEVLRPVVRDHLPRVLCVAKGPLCVALKVESEDNGGVTPLSRILRKCLRKFLIGGDDGNSSFRRNRRMVDIPSLGVAIGAMAPGRERAALKRIEGDAYLDKPHAGASHFLEDVAAACKEHPAELNRKTNGGSE
ncbi:unnamed protein product, partial [Prorocentrum cordatum]